MDINTTACLTIAALALINAGRLAWQRAGYASRSATRARRAAAAKPVRHQTRKIVVSFAS